MAGRLNIVRNLANSLYDKEPEIRKAAREAFRVLNGIEPLKTLKAYYNVQDSKAKAVEKRIKEYDTERIRLTYNNPNSRPVNKVPPPFESWFEVEVFLKIHERGYIVLPQSVYSASKEGQNYRIDMVIVSSDNGKNRIYIECDGPPHNEIKRQEEDRNKEKDLKKNSWSVWRIKHSEEKTPSLSGPPFYSHYPNWKDRKISEDAPQGLWEKLEEMKIKPVE